MCSSRRGAEEAKYMRSNLIQAHRILAFGLALVSLTFGTQTAQAQDNTLKERCLGAAVRINYHRPHNGIVATGHGTAFCVDLSAYGYSGNRYLLTAAHNVLDDDGKVFDTLQIELKETRRTIWSRCKVLAFDKDLDLCIVEANDPVPAQVELADSDLDVGAKLLLAGSPRGKEVQVFEGTLTKRFESGSIRSAARIPFDHGDSGGPFYCARSGKVIGIAVAGVPKDGDMDYNIGLYVPIVGIKSFLERHRIGSPRPREAMVRSEPLVTKPAPIVPAALTAPAPVQTPAQTPVVASKPVVTEPQKELAPNLKVHAPAVTAAPVREADTAARMQTEVPAPKEPEVVQAAPAPNKAPVIEVAGGDEAAALPAASKPAAYMVREGDNLTRIAKRFNITLQALIEANNLRNPNLLYVGTTLRIP